MKKKIKMGTCSQRNNPRIVLQIELLISSNQNFKLNIKNFKTKTDSEKAKVFQLLANANLKSF